MDEYEAYYLERAKRANPFVPPEACEAYAFGYGADDDAIGQALRIEHIGKTIGLTNDEAWLIGEAVGLYSHHIKDGRNACIDCINYQHTRRSNHGVCLAVGTGKLTHMVKHAKANYFQLSRCSAFVSRGGVTPSPPPTKHDSVADMPDDLL